MKTQPFQPRHINAQQQDFEGNNGIGRYVFLPGSNERAKKISENFINLSVKEHGRGHHLFLGQLATMHGDIDVAAVSSGMGCPSMEIIMHELSSLGVKRFLRVGTSGTLQPKTVKLGDIINVTGAVRDESTTQDYIPISFPAISSYELNTAIRNAAASSNLHDKFHSGIVHCKSSFYAREFGVGPRAKDNEDYLDLLSRSGVLVTEMETSTLLIQAHLFNHELQLQGVGPTYQVFAGAILAVVSSTQEQMLNPSEVQQVESDLIKLGLEAIRNLAISEQIK